MENVTSAAVSGQEASCTLSRQDRRTVLGANLRLLSQRVRHGIPVLRGDISRMVVFADDADRNAERDA